MVMTVQSANSFLIVFWKKDEKILGICIVDLLNYISINFDYTENDENVFWQIHS
jgi:hypothetical protein